ncbi:hypothetical protein SCORR_v1c05820 [Spiroplasma corruscae]|uniref:Uncharacterized protein n=1 Tax=Spiroplasma corruscae TaxID=216934 RepID=A0A222EQ00_9MOLU|nr:hypothetical protein [Spiroplasma corruscae]ASP28354.1 hypothetical protein SCORR_v1c05820 [Spiroplasma corruscae]
MKGISLDIMKQIKLSVIRDLSNKLNDINTNAQKLGWSKRHIYRKLNGLRTIGPKAFIHKINGKTPKK